MQVATTICNSPPRPNPSLRTSIWAHAANVESPVAASRTAHSTIPLRPMANWTRFFPMLLAAHCNLGTICTASSTFQPTSTDQNGQGPTFSPMILTCVLIGAVLVSQARGDVRSGVVQGIVENANSGEPLPGATVSAKRPFVTTEGSKKVYNFEQTQVALSGKSAVDLVPAYRSRRRSGMTKQPSGCASGIHLTRQK